MLLNVDICILHGVVDAAASVVKALSFRQLSTLTIMTWMNGNLHRHATTDMLLSVVMSNVVFPAAQRVRGKSINCCAQTAQRLLLVTSGDVTWAGVLAAELWRASTTARLPANSSQQQWCVCVCVYFSVQGCFGLTCRIIRILTVCLTVKCI